MPANPSDKSKLGAATSRRDDPDNDSLRIERPRPKPDRQRAGARPVDTQSEHPDRRNRSASTEKDRTTRALARLERTRIDPTYGGTEVIVGTRTIAAQL